MPALFSAQIQDQGLDTLIASTNADEETARLIIREDGKIIHLNEAFLNITGLNFEELVGQDLLNHFTLGANTNTLSETRNGIHSLSLQNDPENFTQSFYFNWIKGISDHRYLVGSHILDLNNPVREPQKRQIEQNAASVPKTSQRKLSSKDLSVFFSMGDDLMAILNLDGSINQRNKFFSKFFTNLNAQKNAAFYTLFDEIDHRQIVSIFRSLKEDPEQKLKAMLRTTDSLGCTNWSSWTFTAKNDAIYARGQDITDAREHELALKKREGQLLETESIARMGHWTWQIGAEHMEWSAEIFRIFGLSDSDPCPRFHDLDQFVHPEDIGRVNQAFQRAIIECNDYDMEFRVIRPDETIVHLRCEGRCALDEDGEVIALYGIMQDMTERLAYERKLKTAKEKAEHAYNAKSQFLANMSHELRTPLNAILGFSDMIQQQMLGPIDNPTYLEYAHAIHDSGTHLLDLISDVLDMSKIEAGKYELSKEDIDVESIIKSAVQMVHNRAKNAGLTLTTNLTIDDTAALIADRRAILQVLLNLLSNAIKFSRRDDTVTLSCDLNHKSLECRVIDTGIGIPEHKLALITRPFEQVSCSYTREHEGSGLGLAITKELIEMHGGSLKITSKLGHGTTVSFSLPLTS